MEIHEETLEVFRRCAGLVADAIIKKTCPYQDDISEHQANERYGKDWLRFHRKNKNIKYHVVGRRYLYSVHELNCLQAAERDNYEAIMKTIHKDGE